MRQFILKIGFAAVVFMPSAVVAQSAPPSVGVMQMEDLAQTGSAESFSTMIETAIARTGRFRVIPREQLARRLQPPARNGARNSASRNRRIPQDVGSVDYLISGSITSVSARVRTNIGTSLLGGALSGLLSGLSGAGATGSNTLVTGAISGASSRASENVGNIHCSNQEATLIVDIRVTDAGTGEIRRVAQITEIQRAAAVCSGQTEINTPSLLRPAAEKVANALVTAVYPIQIAALQTDGTIILNYGTGTVQPGAILTVYSRGQPVRDPTTGQVIGNEETKLGHVRVSEVSERMSRAVAVGTFTTQPPVGAVLRPATPEDIRGLPRNQRRGRSRQ